MEQHLGSGVSHLDLVPAATAATLCHSVQVSHSVVSDSWRPQGLQHARLPCKTWTDGKTYHASGFTYKFISVPFRKQVHFQLDSVQFSRSVVSDSATHGL